MKNVRFLITLVTLSFCCGLHGQTKTFRLFNIANQYVYNTHVAHLLDGDRMIVDMADVTDYTTLPNLDSIVRQLQRDVDFYKDSFSATDNVRIDYVLEKDSDKIMMRFRKYSTDGDIYVKRNGVLSRMKVEQDTIRLIFRKPAIEHSSHMSLYDFPVQVTFLLNNYADINTVLNDHGLLKHIIDTFAYTALPKIYHPDISEHRTFIDYYPYKRNKKLVFASSDMNDEQSLTKNK